jgi:Uma2 family endonuclease
MTHNPQATPGGVPPRVEIVSADDWLALPDAHRHHELVAGHLTLKPSPDLHYDLIVSDLARALRGVVSSAEEGGRVVSRTGFAVSGPDEDQTVLVPALAFISAERLAREPLIASSPSGTHTSGLLRVAPDLVVEVASPSQREPDLAERVVLWHAAGVRLVWVVWPARRQVAVWALGTAGTRTCTRTSEVEAADGSHPRTLSAHDTLDGGEALANFAYTVGHLFL